MLDLEKHILMKFGKPGSRAVNSLFAVGYYKEKSRWKQIMVIKDLRLLLAKKQGRQIQSRN